MSETHIRYKPNTTKFDFDEDHYLKFLRYNRDENPRFEFDPDWIKYLRSSNGGVPVTDLFKTPNGEVRAIDVFYPMKGSKDPSFGSVGRIHTMACDSEAFHYDCIPFAQLFNGDLLCFDHRTNPAGPAPVLRHHFFKDSI